MPTVCRDDEVRAVRDAETGSPLMELCVDDMWLALNCSAQNFTQNSTEEPATSSSGGTGEPQIDNLPQPANLQVRSLVPDLFVSWEAPSSDRTIADYAVSCSTVVPPDQMVTLTLSLTTDQTSVLVPLPPAQEARSFTCCVTAQYESTGTGNLSPPSCEEVLVESITPTSTGPSILVLVLGVLVGVLFLALLVVSIALVIFVATGSSRMKQATQDLHDGIPELERKE